MRQPTSGEHCPNTTITWLNAAQALAANTSVAIGAALSGALPAKSVVVATPRVRLPGTAGGARPAYFIYVDANNHVTLEISNNNANALVALGAGADVIFDVVALPIQP